MIVIRGARSLLAAAGSSSSKHRAATAALQARRLHLRSLSPPRPPFTALRSRRPSRHTYTRLNSSYAATSTTPTSIDVRASLPHDQQRAFDRLRPIIESFRSPIDFAAAYGSGVMHQANASPTGPTPLTDFLLSTPSPLNFHTTNLSQNPSHYPTLFRVLGPRACAWMQDSWGAGVWYVTHVTVHGLEIKYGVVSTERLVRDLVTWDTIYFAGRLHKPVLPLSLPSSLETPLRTNHASALHLSLLLLPPIFTETELYEQIAGISYSGDPRMSVPGAENPAKVRNIVSGKGSLEGFRRVYGSLLEEAQLGVRREDNWGTEKGSEGGKEEANVAVEGRMIQPDSADHRAQLVARLPAGLVARLQVRTGIGEKWAQLLASRPDMREILRKEVASIMYRPALTQSLKGLFTAGLVKSFHYSAAKFRKWVAGRSKR